MMKNIIFKAYILYIITLIIIFYNIYNKEINTDVKTYNIIESNIEEIYIDRGDYDDIISLKIERISNYIKSKNRKLNDDYINKLSKIIYEESINYNIDKYLLISLIETESTFDINVEHDIDDVKGLGGIYWKWWKEHLIENEIAEDINDLYKIRVSVQATCFVLNYYKNKFNSELEYLTAYKGISKLGERRAKFVLKKAIDIRKIINT